MKPSTVLILLVSAVLSLALAAALGCFKEADVSADDDDVADDDDDIDDDDDLGGDDDIEGRSAYTLCKTGSEGVAQGYTLDLNGALLIFNLDQDASDACGRAYPTNHGATAFPETALEAGASYRFKREAVMQGDYIDTSYKLDLPENFRATISAWIKLETDKAAGTYFYIMGSDTALLNVNKSALMFGIDGSTFKLTLTARDREYNEKTLAGTTALAPLVWYHVVGVVDASTQQMALYVDGSLDNTGSTEFTSDLENVYSQSIGALNDSGAITDNGNKHFFNGLIDELVVWDRALNSDEVSGLY